MPSSLFLSLHVYVHTRTYAVRLAGLAQQEVICTKPPHREDQGHQQSGGEGELQEQVQHHDPCVARDACLWWSGMGSVRNQIPLVIDCPRRMAHLAFHNTHTHDSAQYRTSSKSATQTHTHPPAKPVPEDQAVMVDGPWYLEVSPSMEASPMPDLCQEEEVGWWFDHGRGKRGSVRGMNGLCKHTHTLFFSPNTLTRLQ